MNNLKITTNSDCLLQKNAITLQTKKMRLYFAIILATIPFLSKGSIGSDTLFLKEINVTAIKSTATESDKARAKTLIDRSTAERLGILSAKDATAIAPNFYIPDYGSRITSSIYVRGIGARIDQPVVGMNIDNIPLLNKDNYDFDISDIETMEIIRGPQSTLYGRNTMGGVINVQTISPFDYQGTRISLGYGNGNSINANIGYYNKTSEQFGLGATITYRHGSGFFKNNFNGENCDKENSGRISLKTIWKPKENIAIENAASSTIVHQGGYAYEYVKTGGIAYNDTCFYRRTSILDGLTIKANLEDVSISSITSYQFLNDNMTLDQDFLPQPYFTLTQKKKEHGITQDLIVKSNGNKKIKWLAGAFAFFKRTEMDAPVTFKQTGIEELIIKKPNEMNPIYPIEWDSNSFVLGSKFRMPSYGLAAYGEISIDIDKFTLTAGLRIDHEHTKLNYDSDCNTNYTIFHVTENSKEIYKHKEINIHTKGSLSKSFNELLPKISVIYKIKSNCHLFANLSKGYKAGGFNTQMFSDVLQQELMNEMGIDKLYTINEIIGYKPEKSWNYEIGGHITLADGKIQTEATAFYIDCRDQQLTVFPEGTTTGRIMANAGKSRSIGAEISVTARPVNRLTINASYGYTNAKFINFNDGQNNYSGKFVPYAPMNTLNASAAYSLRIGDGYLRYITFDASTTCAGKIYWNEKNSLHQNFYALLNAGIKLSAEKASLQIWAKNITGTQYSTFYFVSIKHEFLQRGKPARFGATIKINI